MTTKIGVISDTHIPKRAAAIPPALLQAFSGVDLIIHAGDLVEEQVIRQLEQIAPVRAVAGNIDKAPVSELLPKQQLIEISGHTLGVVHGDGTSGTTIKRARKAFSEQKVDCIIFGHSHKPVIEYVDGVLMVNPGSPTDPRREPLPSFAILTLGAELEAKIYYINGDQVIEE